MNRNSANHHYNKRLKPYARDLRNNMTKAEACLWKYGLRKKQRCNYSFNRQRPVLNYIADFMCKKLHLIIEVDGGIHNLPENIVKDKKRQDDLEAAGFTVLRFTNQEVLHNMDAVCQRIDEEIERLEAG